MTPMSVKTPITLRSVVPAIPKEPGERAHLEEDLTRMYRNTDEHRVCPCVERRTQVTSICSEEVSIFSFFLSNSCVQIAFCGAAGVLRVRGYFS